MLSLDSSFLYGTDRRSLFEAKNKGILEDDRAIFPSWAEKFAQSWESMNDQHSKLPSRTAQQTLLFKKEKEII